MPLLSPETHVTLLGSAAGRDVAVALWGDGEGEDRVELVLPAGEGVRRRDVAARVVALGDLLDELVATRLEDPRSRSARAWGQVIRIALELVALGRLQPAADADGVDRWRLAPLTEDDLAVRAALADWLPPEAHATPVPETRPLRIADPRDAVATVADAVADLLPRTAAAALASGQGAWASAEPHDVGHLRHLLGAPGSERTIVGLRLVPPTDDDRPVQITIQVRSATDPSLVADATELWAGTAVGFEPETETDLLVALRRGSRMWPPLAAALDATHPATFELDDEAAARLLGGQVDLSGAGIEVLVPSSLTRTLTATAHVEPPPGAGDAPSRFDLASVCELTWRPTVDGQPVGEDELARLAASRRPLVRLRGEWVVVDPAVVAKLGRREQVSGAAALRAALSGAIATGDLEAGGSAAPAEVVGPAADLAQRLRTAATAHEEPEPERLRAELRPYQRRGLAWLGDMVELGLGGVLADDMGLGKTVQLIALHLARAEAAPTLVVCPASVVGNWEAELTRFAPDVVVHRYHGAERTLGEVADGDVVVTTYGIARRDRTTLADRRWGLVVADEAQHIKNPNSSAARALRTLRADARIAMTGTPVENRLTELWALLDWTTPGLLGPVDAFRREVSLPIERERDAETTTRFARMIAPFVLRRRKDDPGIAPDLPPKTETVHPVELSPEQAGLYKAAADEILEQVERAQGIARRGLVLKLLTALKQICNHPAHYLHQPGPLAGRSGKLDAFDELVTSISDAGDATLVFTQYVAMAELLGERLAQLGIGHQLLTGSLSLGKRTQLVERFQAGAVPVFVISLKAGGTGLNLTRATHVVHYDRWWNPAVEQQASDRAWRIGQDRPVQVHQLICSGTLEERIAEALADKAALARAVIGGGEQWLGELSDDDLAALVRLGAEEPLR